MNVSKRELVREFLALHDKVALAPVRKPLRIPKNETVSSFTKEFVPVVMELMSGALW